MKRDKAISCSLGDKEEPDIPIDCEYCSIDPNCGAIEVGRLYRRAVSTMNQRMMDATQYAEIHRAV